MENIELFLSLQLFFSVISHLDLLVGAARVRLLPSHRDRETGYYLFMFTCRRHGSLVLKKDISWRNVYTISSVGEGLYHSKEAQKEFTSFLK